MQKPLVYILILAGIVSCTALGCREPGTLKGLVAGSGTVMYNDKPLAHATITFHPPEGSGMRSATALTSAEGAFTLRTLKANDGIAPGEYRVTVLKIETRNADSATMEDVMSGKAKPSTMDKTTSVYLIPEKYSNPQTSGLTATVNPKGKNHFTFELKGK